MGPRSLNVKVSANTDYIGFGPVTGEKGGLVLQSAIVEVEDGSYNKEAVLKKVPSQQRATRLRDMIIS